MRKIRKVEFKRRPKRKAKAAKPKTPSVAAVETTERQPARNPFFSEWWHRQAEKQAERQRDASDR